MTLIRTSTLAVLAAASMASAQAQTPGKDWPAKPITAIMYSSPGGADVLLRLHTTEITNATGWQFIVDYKLGAAGNIATAYALKQPADGYTLLSGSASVLLSEIMEDRPPFDGWKELVPVYQLYRSPQLIVVGNSLPVKNLQEYIAYGKANPEKINWGMLGLNGVQRLTAEMLHREIGVKVTPVPYKGSQPIVQGVMNGEIQATMQSPRNLVPLIKTGKMRALAITIRNGRIKDLPGVTSVAEQGLPDFNHYSWIGFFYRAETPAAIVNAVNAEFNKAAKSPEVISRYESLGEGLGGGTAEEFRKETGAQRERWIKLARQLDMKLGGE